MNKPCILTFPTLGSADMGYISIAELKQNVPFEVKRIFWTYATPEHVTRGRHAHYHTEQVLIALSGRIIITTELPEGEIHTFVLDKPEQGLYIPPYVWPTMQYSQNAVQLVLASTEYNESDYIRDFNTFRKICGK